MPSTFWSNTIWFILLGISTVIEFIFIFAKAENRKTALALFFTLSGITFAYEAVICCFLKAYSYFPMILPKLPLDDQLAGNIFSQFSVAATAVLVEVLNLKYYWVLIIAGIYALIEELFINIGVYKHNWYSTWMTFIGFILLSGLTSKIYTNTFKGTSRTLHYICIFFGLYTLHMITVLWAFKLIGIISFNTKIFPDDLSSYALLALSNLFLLIIICMVVYFSKLKWLWKSLLVLALYAALYFANKVNLIYFKEGWFFIFATIDIFGMFLYVYVLDKLYSRK